MKKTNSIGAGRRNAIYFTTNKIMMANVRLKIADTIGLVKTKMLAYKGRNRAPEFDGDYNTFDLQRYGNNPFLQDTETLIN